MFTTKTGANLVEEVEVHVGFFFLFLFRSGSRGTAGVAAGSRAARRGGAARRNRGELFGALLDEFGDILTLDFLHEGGELGVIDFSGGCDFESERGKKRVVSVCDVNVESTRESETLKERLVLRSPRSVGIENRFERAQSRRVRTTGENSLDIGFGRGFLTTELRLRTV